MRNESQWSKQNSASLGLVDRTLCFWLLGLVAVLAVPQILPLVLLLTAIFALLNSGMAANALVISWLVSFLNPGFVSSVPGLFFFKILILFAASIQAATLMVNQKSISKAQLAILAFGLMVVISAAFSQLPILSLLKGVLFTLGALTSLVLFRFHNDIGGFQHWLFMMCIAIVILSLPMLIHPNGYLRNGSGFQGILSHPQAFGLFMSLFTTWATLGYFMSTNPPIRKGILKLVLLISLAFLVLSEARVALLAYALSVLVINVVMGRGAKNLLYMTVAFVSALSLVLVVPYFREIFQEFFLKRRVGLDLDLFGLYWNSRGVILEASISNFIDNPIFGIGFGVPSDITKVEITRDPVFGLPISAPIEKGFFLVAIFEEVGVMAGLIFIWALLLVFISSVKSSDIALAGTALTAFLLNTTESMIFSMSGFGLIVWVFIGMATAKRNL